MDYHFCPALASGNGCNHGFHLHLHRDRATNLRSRSRPYPKSTPLVTVAKYFNTFFKSVRLVWKTTDRQIMMVWRTADDESFGRRPPPNEIMKLNSQRPSAKVIDHQDFARQSPSGGIPVCQTTPTFLKKKVVSISQIIDQQQSARRSLSAGPPSR